MGSFTLGLAIALHKLKPTTHSLGQASQCESMADLLRLLPQASQLGGLDGLVGGLGLHFECFAKKPEATPVNFFGQSDAPNERKRTIQFGKETSRRAAAKVRRGFSA